MNSRFLTAFTTKRLRAQAVSLADLELVTDVYAQNQALLSILDREANPQILATRFVHSLDLPPQGASENMHNLLLRGRDTEQVVGILSVYLGYPAPQIAYVGELFLCSVQQGKGLGSEAYTQLETLLRSQRMHRVRVGVALRNWNGLRFWVHHGFVRVTGMSGDRIFGEQNFAHLELQKTL